MYFKAERDAVDVMSVVDLSSSSSAWSTVVRKKKLLLTFLAWGKKMNRNFADGRTSSPLTFPRALGLPLLTCHGRVAVVLNSLTDNIDKWSLIVSSHSRLELSSILSKLN